MIELRGYIDGNGNKRFAAWFKGLDPPAAAKVTIALTRMEQGNLSNTKGVGAGVYEYKIDFGPGYRIYFGRDGERIVILTAGRRNARTRTFRRRRHAGLTTNDERSRRLNNAPYSRLQRNHPGAGATRSGFPPGAPP